MAQATKIEWTEQSWNFLRGCSRVSEGCKNCYAERQAARFTGAGRPYEGLVRSTPGGPKWTGEISFHDNILLEPLKRRAPTKYFVNSMSDLFHEKVWDEWLDKAFAVMALTPQHTYQVLTKRPERMKEYLTWDALPPMGDWGRFDEIAIAGKVWTQYPRQFDDIAWPLPNVWLGVSVEDQKTADERIPLLLQTPAAVRWVSAEPLLEQVNLYEGWRYGGCAACCWTGCQPAIGPIGGFVECACVVPHLRDDTFAKLNWVVVGGESGPGARACDISNIRSIVDQCKAAGVPVFVKQVGAKPFMGIKGFGPLIRDRKGGDMSEWPEDIRIREFPK